MHDTKGPTKDRVTKEAKRGGAETTWIGGNQEKRIHIKIPSKPVLKRSIEETLGTSKLICTQKFLIQ